MPDDGDLTPVELAVYRALVDEPGTAAGLAARTGLPARRLSAVLRALVAGGMVVRSVDRPARFTAIAPEVALGGAVLRKERQLEAVRRLTAELQERHRRAVLGHDPGRLLEVVTGGPSIARRADQVMRGARREVRFVDKAPYAQPPTVLHPVERDLLGRGVRFRGVYDLAALELHDLASDLEAGLDLGEEARVVPDAPLKMILVDGSVGLIPLDSAVPASGAALVVRPCTLLDALGVLFESLWRQGFPLAMPSGSVLSTVDSRLLALLTTGMPDRSIAKQLGLSYRTYQRRLRVLMDELGAQTRFQAGLRAAARGWVPVSRDGRPVPPPG
ncbi:helix-turn-helix domain-containing protein [Actinosynnema sp. NPDC020468]|uniref:helix-turn-helix domain-containing protein n=1 Tax=Actinosynnema sp. NPDC020468 TaxID=3154488 RepID=UPI0033EEF6CF